MAAEMAVALVVSPLLGAVFDKLSSSILKTFGSIYGINDDLEELSGSLSRIRAVLLDAETKQITDTATRNWLGKLKDAAYEADDIIDECATKSLFFLDSGINLGSSSSTQVGHSFLSSINFKPLSLRRKIAKKIKNIVTKFDGIAAEKDKFQLREGVLESPAADFMQQRETSSELWEPVVYGREDDKKNFVRILLNNANGENDLQVYPVVGIGGLGKTTFAQLIYKDQSIVEAFPTRIWVCVSEDFSVKRLTKKIIACLTGKECTLADLEPLQNHLKGLLKGKKFLLVLDDVWNETREIWEKLKVSLKYGAKGSSVVVTTRLLTVAEIMSTHSKYELPALSVKNSWKLFRGSAFGMKEEADENLKAIGKQIVRKCGGVPLVAKTLGGSLYGKRDASMWKSVRDNEIWKLEREKGTILPSLGLSYNHLPAYLRECFVYCSVFPKDHEMEVEELIQLWMANGFLQSEGRVDLEEVGNDIFKELVFRSFLQDVSETRDGKQVCKMHDLMHDLARSVAREECYDLKRGEKLVTTKSIRHLWIPSISVDTQFGSPPRLRTCLFSPLFSSSVEITLRNLTCLRALQFKVPLILPRAIGKMIHLRYLNLSLSLFEHLPKSICSLKNLQTLNLHRCHKLKKLPESLNKLINLRHLDLSYCRSLTQLPDWIGELINLRHLDLSSCGSLTQLPDRIGELSNLRHLDLSGCGLTQLPDGVGGLINLRHVDFTHCYNLIHLPHRIGELINLRHLILRWCSKLIQMPIGICKLRWLERLETFIVGPEDSGADITELQGLNHLGGHLRIQGLEHVRNGAEANLTAKQKLSSLELIWGNVGSNSENVIQGLQPSHESLKYLSISGYGGSVFPSWIQSLVRLVEIKLEYCSKCEELPPLGHLPLLKKLEIFNMGSLKRINKELYGGITSSSSEAASFFPSLEKLEFRFMDNWGEWESPEHHQQVVFPCLKSLELWNCPKLPSLPFSIQHSVQELVIDGNCEKLVVRSLPCLRYLRFTCVSSIPVGSLQNFDAVQSLELNSCDITSIPQQMQNLSSLNKLSIWNCPLLEISSGDFQHLLALQSLELNKLPKLTSLPDLHHLPNLQSLHILECSNLRELKQWMQNLTSLRSLGIFNCHPDLHIGCKEDKGKYWPYISHIPKLGISHINLSHHIYLSRTP